MALKQVSAKIQQQQQQQLGMVRKMLYMFIVYILLIIIVASNWKWCFFYRPGVTLGCRWEEEEGLEVELTCPHNSSNSYKVGVACNQEVEWDQEEVEEEEFILSNPIHSSSCMEEEELNRFIVYPYFVVDCKYFQYFIIKQGNETLWLHVHVYLHWLLLFFIVI